MKRTRHFKQYFFLNFQFCDNHGKLLCTVFEHQERVNCVGWIHDSKPVKERLFLSGSADKSVIVWECDLNDSKRSCSKVAKLTGNVSIHLILYAIILKTFFPHNRSRGIN